ncbi:sunset domain-containing protein [Lacticaseibacillus zhaodongensis]|uniref:sunset domain-containing protein n=1 Tax=Lacticaseibacillus zhaodongensis TaxID=2668065 RepID=UPI001E28C5BF|nr:DNA-entry nuclease [Lacticaseibacillus zhaodongensis]
MSLFMLIVAAVATAGAWYLWHRGHGKPRQLALMAIIIAVFSVFGSACSARPSTTPRVITKTHLIKIGTARKNRAVAVSSKLDDQFAKLSSKSESLSSASSKFDAAASSKAAAASSSSRAAAAASSAAASSQAAAASSEASAASSRARAATTHSAPTNHGNLTTGGQGKIIGNANSKIYHVPGQAGYRMNSANAVYFNTEAEARAAGYRRSLR